MGNSKKKILIIVTIVLVIIIALAGTVAGTILTGKVAITTRQKLVKGLSDIGTRISLSELEKNLTEYEKMQRTPYESETTITANINKLELEDADGMQEMLDEIKNVVENTKITNTVQADLRNNIIKENIKLNLADIVGEISADLEYSQDRISLRSKELNEKYITLTKNDVMSSSEYAELEEIFNLFENNSDENLYLTEDEKAHFVDYYKEIFSNFITDDMLKEEKVTISVDGEKTNCSEINLTLNKNQIVEFVGAYLKRLENDTQGKQIIINKFKIFEREFDEDNLIEMIDDIKGELLDLDDDTTLKASIYCTMFKTYGFEVKVYDGYDMYTLSLILGNETDELYLKENEETILKAEKQKNIITITSVTDELSVVINITTIGNRRIIEMNLEDLEDDMKINITLTSDQITKTEQQNTSKTVIQFEIIEGNNNVNAQLNIDSNIIYVNGIEPTTLKTSEAINLISGEEQEIEQYLTEIQNNAVGLLQNATQNSKLVSMLYNLINMPNIENIPGVEGNLQTAQTQTNTEFNNMFRDYTGTQTGTAIKTLLEILANSNKENSIHKVSVSIVENGNVVLNNVTDEQGLTTASILNVNPDYQYEIFVTSLSDDGFIQAIEIRNN